MENAPSLITHRNWVLNQNNWHIIILKILKKEISIILRIYYMKGLIMSSIQIEKYNKFVKEVDDLFDKLKNEQSEIDKKETDILHFIELEKYSASTGAKLLKLLKSIRQQRRIIKDDFADIHSVKMKLSGKLERKVTEKHYSYRTNVLDMLKETK